MFKYGTTIGNETLEIEFKEFNLAIPCANARRTIKSIKISPDFVKCVEDNIGYFFKRYIPKYVSAYNNSRIAGKIYFGIDDSGVCTGIVHPHMTETLIRKYLDECKHLIDCPEYIDNIVIAIHKVEYIEDIKNVSAIKKNIAKYYDKFCFQFCAQDDLRQKKARILRKIDRYHTQVIKFFEDPPLINEAKLFVEKMCDDLEMVPELLRQLYDPPVPITTENIIKYKTDKSCIIHWVLELRDVYTNIYTQKLKHVKGIHGKINKIDQYDYIIKNSQLLVPLMMRNKINRNNLYVIELSFPQHVGYKIRYIENVPGRYKCAVRILDKSGAPITEYIKNNDTVTDSCSDNSEASLNSSPDCDLNNRTKLSNLCAIIS